MFRFDHSYLQFSELLYERIHPIPVIQPKMELWNKELAQELGIQNQEIDPVYFSGNKLIENSIPIAQAYAGHQFGYPNMLGDGRAHLLGEHIIGNNRWDIQLKGSGRTKYSRGGDGRATLNSALREYIYSEAMHGLKIPTTRSLCVVSTGEEVVREILYQGGILTRVSKGHIRVGTLEYAMQVLPLDEYKKFLSYIIGRFYAHLHEEDFIGLFRGICHAQIKLVVDWMRVGFIHGVMNTDNTSLCGETIDYGPCAFLNAYDPRKVYSRIDRDGRYAYGKQPEIMHWNMAVLAHCFIKVIHADEQKAVEILTDVLNEIPKIWKESYENMLLAKLGLTDKRYLHLVDELVDWMFQEQQDYTNTFVKLMYPELLGESTISNEWMKAWKAANPDLNLMKANNPIVIPRNQLVEDAIINYCEGNKDDYLKLLDVVRDPYSPEHDKLFLTSDKDAQGFYTHCNT